MLQKDQDNQQLSSEGQSKLSSITPISKPITDASQPLAFNFQQKERRFKDRSSPQGRVLQQTPLIPSQNQKFVGGPLLPQNSNTLPMTSDQYVLNQTQKFLPKKKKSIISVTGTNKNTINVNNNSNNLPPMPSQAQNNVQNLTSLSPSKIDDKISKSTSNKAYMISQSNQSLEDSKRVITQQYLKTYQKINTIVKHNPSNEVLNQPISSNPSRFGKQSFLHVKDNENKSQSLLQPSNQDIQSDDLYDQNDNSHQQKNSVSSKLQQHQRNQNFLRKSRNSADLYNNQKGALNTQIQQPAANYFSLKTKSSRNNNNQLAKTNEYSQSWQNNQTSGNGKLFQSLRNELSCIEQDSFLLSNYEPAKYSTKRNGIITAYGANTNQGIIRNYNEDRVAIILNIMKPKSKEGKVDYWPKCSFFGIYDGHGGNQCAEFLRDYLHQFVITQIIANIFLNQIIKDDNFPQNPIKAIRNGFREAEKLFLEFAEKQEEEIGDIDRSGSCAIVILIIDETCYVSNVGDSRAIMSADGGEKIFVLSNDHKPTDDVEMKRIIENGGKIYQNSSVIPHQNPAYKGQQQVIFGPHRVFPGRLSVSRTFGDIEAKLEKFEGNPKVVVAEPDITAFKIRNNFDYIIIGCDGIFDKLDNKDCIHLVWQSIQSQNENNKIEQNNKVLDVHQQCGFGVDTILKTAALRKACDNLTVVIIAFDNFENLLTQGNSKNPVKEEQLDEILLTPIPEDHDDENRLNDPSQERPLSKVEDYALYLDNDDALEALDIPIIAAGSEFPIDIQASAVSSISGIQLAKTSSFKIPTQNMLSEISEEDDVSMISERVGLTPGQQRNSKKVSKQHSLQITKAMQFNQAQQLQNTQNLNIQQPTTITQESTIGNINQLPSNQQDNSIIEVGSENLVSRSAQGTKSRQSIQDQLKQINSHTFQTPMTDYNIMNLISNQSQPKVQTPVMKHQQVKTSNSRNGMRTNNSQKSQTQQVQQLLESLNLGGLSQLPHAAAQQQSIPIIRPTSGGKKRISASNGFNNYSKEQRFSHTQQLGQAISNYNTNQSTIQQFKIKNANDLASSQYQQQQYFTSQPQQKNEYKRKSSLGSSGAQGSRLQRIQINMNNPNMVQTQQAYLQKLSGSLSTGSQGKTSSNQKTPNSGAQRWSSLNRAANLTPIAQSQINSGENGGL